MPSNMVSSNTCQQLFPKSGWAFCAFDTLWKGRSSRTKRLPSPFTTRAKYTAFHVRAS